MSALTSEKKEEECEEEKEEGISPPSPFIQHTGNGSTRLPPMSESGNKNIRNAVAGISGP